MSFSRVFFFLLTFTVIKALILGSLVPGVTEFPELDIGEPEFFEPGDCNSIAGCTKFVGVQILNIAQGVLFAAFMVFNIATYLASLSLIVFQLSVTPIPDSPPIIDILTSPFFVGVASLSFYRLFRRGDSV